MSLRSDPSFWSDRRHRDGLEGEVAAIQYLKEQGWRILEHRFRMGRLEIDVVARQGCLVAFVEVKTRLTSRFGSPMEAVTWRKQEEIGRVAQAWLDRHGLPTDTYRFDVIGVTRQSTGQFVVEHLPNAFWTTRR